MRWTKLKLLAAAGLALASASVVFDDQGNCHVRMRRMVSRRRRFIAPGTVLKVEIGLELPWDNLEVWARIPIYYKMDDLFSGRSIMASARDIAAMVSKELAAGRGSSLSTEALKQLASSSLRRHAAQGSALMFTGRAVAEDQVNLFQSIEGAMDELGVDGKACILRTICEMQESPIAEWTFIGELFTHFLTPKEGDFSFLSEYQQARALGAQKGGRDRCRPAYPSCPLSVFNFIPDIVGEDALLHLGNVTMF